MIDRRLCALLLCVLLGPRPALAAGATADDVWIAKGKRPSAPKLALQDLGGQKRQLSQLKGKVVVVNFWATWCGPCVREMPAFTKVYSEYRDRGVEFVGAANETRAERAKVAGFVKKHGVEFPIWLEASLDHMEAFKVGPELPATVLVDQEGKLAARIQGVTDEAQLRALIDRVLLDGTPAPPPNRN